VKKILILCILILSSCTGRHSFNLSNDIIGNTDENFTSQIRFQTNIEAEKASETIKNFAETIPSLVVDDQDPKKLSRILFTVEQNMYTPDDIRNPNVIEDDVPYSGLLEFRAKRINANSERRISTEIALGVVGKYSGAEGLQKFIHNDLGKGAPPNGWDNQIADEPTLNINYSRMWENHRSNFRDWDFVSVGATNYRAGTVHTDFEFVHGWRLGYNVPGMDNAQKLDDFICYTSLDLSARAVVRNLHYDGSLFQDNIHTVDSEPVVNSMNMGIHVEYHNYIIRFDYNIRTKDYVEQKANTHTYGVLSFGTKW
jgi:hypothetical protein